MAQTIPHWMKDMVKVAVDRELDERGYPKLRDEESPYVELEDLSLLVFVTYKQACKEFGVDYDDSWKVDYKDLPVQNRSFLNGICKVIIDKYYVLKRR